MDSNDLSTDFTHITDHDQGAAVHPAWLSFKKALDGRCFGGEALDDAWSWFKDGWVSAKLATPPNEECGVCQSPPGEWCEPGCAEAPRPGHDPGKPTQEQMGNLIADAITMLNASIDDENTKARNYVELNMDWPNGAIKGLPFSRVSLTFYRDGGLSPHQRATIALNEALDAKADVAMSNTRYNRLAEASFEDQKRISVLKAALKLEAGMIVDGIARDLNGRSGFDLDNLDDETKLEIKNSWTQIVKDASALATGYAGE